MWPPKPWTFFACAPHFGKREGPPTQSRILVTLWGGKEPPPRGKGKTFLGDLRAQTRLEPTLEFKPILWVPIPRIVSQNLVVPKNFGFRTPGTRESAPVRGFVNSPPRFRVTGPGGFVV